MSTNRFDLQDKITNAIELVRHGKIDFTVNIGDGVPLSLESVFLTPDGIKITRKELLGRQLKPMND
ncbi:hypothetical protein AUJ63_04610 [Candidatus Pacearchaeota archaeon CG1_02_35_32]|nr:MAG: hypothetical protein AUJ63_04610 [Candidatus Pacearchaeota archaeon CG1_02_35_32]